VTELDALIGSLTKDLAAAEAQKKTIVARAAAKAEKRERRSGSRPGRSLRRRSKRRR